MSERFIEGFIVSPRKLASLLGTAALSPKAIKARLKNKPVLADVITTLGSGDDDEAAVDRALGALADGTPKKSRAYELARVTALVLHAYAAPLGTLEANYMPSDASGLWTPAFRALGMPTIAKQWGKASLPFPFVKPAKVAWPLITLVDPASLARWQSELGKPWRKTLASLPIKKLDPDATTDEGRYFTRDEVERGLSGLVEWVARARGKTKVRVATGSSRNALVLILDGDR